MVIHRGDIGLRRDGKFCKKSIYFELLKILSVRTFGVLGTKPGFIIAVL